VTTTSTSIGSSNAIITYKTEWHDAINHANEEFPEYQTVRATMICRATLAYFDNATGNDFGIPTERYSYTWRDPKTGFSYVVLGAPDEGHFAGGEILAVYRIDTRAKLKRLRRVPLSLRGFHHQAWVASVLMEEAAENLNRGKVAA